MDEQALVAQRAIVVGTFERQGAAFTPSGLLLDDGVIDPRGTRVVLATCREAERRVLCPIQFSVARP